MSDGETLALGIVVVVFWLIGLVLFSLQTFIAFKLWFPRGRRASLCLAMLTALRESA
jgi:hypothetical protein